MRTNLVFGMTFATLMLAGCGTIVHGGTQTLDVVVKGSPSAFCDIKTSVYRNSGTFPNKVTLERSREPLQLECRGEQNLYKKFEVAAIPQNKEAVGGNVANGTTVLGLSYDMFSGGAWAYPDPLIVDFRVVGEGPKPAWPEDAADGQAAFIAKPTPVEKPAAVRMQPVVDEQLNPALPARATAKPQVVDAVSIATENPKPATKKVSAPASASKMKPVTSPEDKMGADPAKVKAKEAAKAKAAADAKKKAAAAAAAKKKAAEEAKAKAAAEAAEAKAETLPEATSDTAPAEAAAPSAPEAPAASAEAPVAPAPAAAVVPPAPAAVAPPAPAVVTPPKAQENAAPAPKASGESVDIDKYLTGDGQ